ncbi:alpha/beta hydrolase [Streptomyces spongiae]|uniref:Alpha/beta fold hydrolase n=1 Tax=Streptomyces spongiae TaxID=565072 RepID=A0A5N8X9R2_9ACTN|nr:alpha/beta fold hydrolase [Streptomyces spongiae]MPY55936.1 alpha/beta fold hydrolase [Streptomyces spongiae]
MGERLSVRIPVDGDELDAWWYAPRGVDAPAPCVVLAHGFGAIKEMRLGAYAERFAAAGLGALVFDYRHFGASGGRPRNLLDIGRQLADWKAAVAAARVRPEVDPDRVAVWGSSMSGGAVVLVAAADPRIAAVVSQAPLADGRAALFHMLRGSARHVMALGVAGVRDTVGALLGRGPHTLRAAGRPGDRDAVLTTPDAYESMIRLLPPEAPYDNEVSARVILTLPFFRAVKAAPRLTCPLLVQVMDHDDITPPGPGAALAAAARHGELLAYPGGHFDPYAGEGFDRVLPDQIAFLARVLRTGTA